MNTSAGVLAEGPIAKMRTQLAAPVQYQLPVADRLVAMNALIGATIRLRFLGNITCVHCGRATPKRLTCPRCCSMARTSSRASASSPAT